MNWIVLRLCEGGRALPRRLVWASEVRGMLSVREEPDPERHRAVRVARLLNGSTRPAIPPLHDVQLIACHGDRWTLTGFERVAVGPLQAEHAFAQSWMIVPAPCEDLAKAETKIDLLARQLAQTLHGGADL